MTYKNYIFIDDAFRNKPIYRIFPIKRFLQILTTKKLTLLKPHKWDDPFENALLKKEFEFCGEMASFEAKNSVYGQCLRWTPLSEQPTHFDKCKESSV